MSLLLFFEPSKVTYFSVLKKKEFTSKEIILCLRFMEFPPDELLLLCQICMVFCESIFSFLGLEIEILNYTSSLQRRLL